MKYNKRIISLLLSLIVLIMGAQSVFAATEKDEVEQLNGSRMKSAIIGLTGEIFYGSVCTGCSVTGYSYTTSIDLLCILRQEIL